MSEVAASVGSVGGAVAAGPAAGLGAGPSMGGEIGMSGIGFEGGSPSFSGLGRSDNGLGSFSTNEGPRGPVSFSNSTDLFSETRSFVGSITSVPEGSVKGDIFGQTDVIAKTQDAAAGSARRGLAEINLSSEPVSLFDNTVPFQATIPANEGPAPLSLGSDFITLTTVSEAPISNPEAEQDFSVDAMIETFVSDQAEHLDIQLETVPDAIQDMKINDPLTYIQLESDLRLVQNIVDIATEEADQKTSTAISNAAINVAVERSGLIQALEQPEDSVDSNAQTEPEAQPVNANVQAIIEAIDSPIEEVVEPKKQKQKEKFYVHEEANEARRSETARAIKQAFEEEVDPETGKVKGKDVVDFLPVELPAEEISEIVLKEGGKNDGSEAQRRNHLSLLEFTTEEEALAANDRLIAENNAVTDEEASKRATEAEAAKVKSGVIANIGEIQVFPLAA